MNGTLSYIEFVEQANKFIEIANKLGDNWTLITIKLNQNYETYLQYNQKLNFNLNEQFKIISIEYNLVYSISYQVPVLYLKANYEDGSTLSLEDAWKLFGDNFSNSVNTNERTKSDLYSILTETEHPILFKPFLCLHPCRTNEILSNTPNSKNLIITFLSLMGPYVKLNLNDKYGVHFK